MFFADDAKMPEVMVPAEPAFEIEVIAPATISDLDENVSVA